MLIEPKKTTSALKTPLVVFLSCFPLHFLGSLDTSTHLLYVDQGETQLKRP